MKGKAIYRYLYYVFSGLTIIGGIYVIASGGKESPGYAVIPMCFSLSFLQLSKSPEDSSFSQKEKHK